MQIFDDILSAHERYSQARLDVDAILREARQRLSEVKEDIRRERGEDAVRIADLEYRLRDTPAERLRALDKKISGLLERGNDLRQDAYGLYRKEAASLQPQRDKLAAEVARTYASEEAEELATLRRKSYSADAHAVAALWALIEAAEEQVTVMHQARSAFEEANQRATAFLRELRQDVVADASIQTAPRSIENLRAELSRL